MTTDTTNKRPHALMRRTVSNLHRWLALRWHVVNMTLSPRERSIIMTTRWIQLGLGQRGGFSTYVDSPLSLLYNTVSIKQFDRFTRLRRQGSQVWLSFSKENSRGVFYLTILKVRLDS